MCIPAFFWIYFILLDKISCLSFPGEGLDCPPPQADVYFRGYETCLDKCPYITFNYEPDSIICYCSEDSNCEHLKATCNTKNQECECLSDHTLVNQTGTCLPKRQLGEDCEFNDQCVDGINGGSERICGGFDGRKCCRREISIPAADGEETVNTMCFPRQELLASCDSHIDCYLPRSICSDFNQTCVCHETSFVLTVYDPLEKLICGYEDQVFTITCTQKDFEICTVGGIYSKCEYKVKSGKQVLQRCVYPVLELTLSKKNGKSCTAEDQYGVEWKAENGLSDVKPCPFGNSDLNAYWSCRNGKFVTKTPNFDECRSEWLDGLEKNITDQPNIDFQHAINQSETIAKTVTAENSTYYGHEMKRISHLIDTIVSKLTPTKENCCNLTQILTTNIVDVTTGLFGMEIHWAQLQNSTEKKETFSDILSTLEEHTMKTIQKGCFPDPTNISSCEWYKKPFKFEQSKVEIGSFSIGDIFTGTFPSGGGSIAGRDTFIQFPRVENASNYIGAIIENKRAIEYSKNERSNKKKKSPIAEPEYCYKLEPNGDVVVFSVSKDSKKTLHEVTQLTEPVVITTQHSKYSLGSEGMEMYRDLHPDEQPSAVMGSTECAYWDNKNLKWSSAGCAVESKTAYETICSCKHLSTFAVVQKCHKYSGKSFILLSTLAVLFFLIAFYLIFNIVAYLQRNEEEIRRGNPIIKFSGILLTLFSYVVVIFFVDKHFFLFNPISCYRIGIISHFAILMFTFVLILKSCKQTVDIACIHKLKFIMDLAQINQTMFSLGAPFCLALIIVGSTVWCDIWNGPKLKAYGGEFCWLDGHFIYALFVPMWTSIAVNYLLLGILTRKCIKMVKGGVSNSQSLSGKVLKTANIMSFVKEGLAINSLVLITWLVGFFSLGPNYKDFRILRYVFPFLLFLQSYLINQVLDKDKYVGKLKEKAVGYFVRKYLSPNRGTVSTTSVRDDSKSSENIPMIRRKKADDSEVQPKVSTGYDPSKKGGVKVYPPFNVKNTD